MNHRHETFAAFTDLRCSEATIDGSIRYHVIDIGTGLHLAKSLDGHPVVLVDTLASSEAYPPSLRLEYLAVCYGVSGELVTAHGLSVANLTVIECRIGEPSVVSTFLRLVEYLLSLLPPLPSPRSLALEIRKLVHIFQALRQPAAKSIQGLWAELFVIANSNDVLKWATAWHQDPMDRYDFAFESVRVEVKSSGSRIRRHRFSHEQLHPPKNLSMFVGSVFVERIASGLNCFELLQRIQLSLPVDVRFNVEAIVMELLGNDFQKARDLRFDEELARESLVFYAIETLPRIPEELPEGVADVRYSIQISNDIPRHLDYPVH